MVGTKSWSLVAMLAATLAACGGEEAREAEVEPPGMAGGMEGMEDMPMEGMGGMPMEGMAGMPMSGGMMDEMQGHMQGMEGMDGERFREMLPRHRQMVANLISQMSREMRDMDMEADAEWTSTIEAIREDLVRLPELTPEELEAFMPEHRARVMRLMDMHRAMMAGTGL